MAQHLVKVLESYFVTHDVKCFKVERPKGYDFIPGQATDVSINRPEWEKELRPFTFTGLREWTHLQFTIKIYPHHHGVTEQLGKIDSGAELILHDVFGAIQFKGPGIFIAGGAGVTPFIAIIRDLYHKKNIKDVKLICSNKTSRDVILRDELKTMLKDNFINVYTREHVIGYLDRRIGLNFLTRHIHDFSRHFYVCGPDEFVKDINQLLLDAGAKSNSLVFEQ